MGTPMALNLAAQLHEDGQPPLLVWNRSSDRVDNFLKLCRKGKNGDGKEIPVQVAKVCVPLENQTRRDRLACASMTRLTRAVADDDETPRRTIH